MASDIGDKFKLKKQVYYYLKKLFVAEYKLKILI